MEFRDRYANLLVDGLKRGVKNKLVHRDQGECRVIRLEKEFVTRRNFRDGHIVSTLTPYVEVVKRLAAEKQVPLVDLHARSIAFLEKMGPEAAAVMDPPGVKPGTGDHTHLNERGAEMIAALIVEDLRTAAPDLAAHFTADK